MAARVGDPEALGRLAVNRAVLAQIRTGAQRSSTGIGPWSPDGRVMRTHPDLTEVIEASAPYDLRIVLGVSTLVTSRGVIYAVGLGNAGLWLRYPPGPARDEALATEGVKPVAELPDWIHLRAWRDDLATWLRASATLSADLAPTDA